MLFAYANAICVALTVGVRSIRVLFNAPVLAGWNTARIVTAMERRMRINVRLDMAFSLTSLVYTVDIIPAMRTLGILLFSALLSAQPKIYNTAKLKLMQGKSIIGGTVFSPDPNMYCAMANSGFDFTWIEMQHSPLTYEDVAKMIYACRGSSAMPFVRVPDATESDIQKATDIGALGIIVPTVDTVEKAEAAVKWAKYPPQGRRSMGAGQYGALYGNDY